MGTTRLTWLQKVRDGMLFREDFESDRFVTNDGWFLLQGIATQSKAQAVAGLFSLLLKGTQDDADLPVILQQNVPPIISGQQPTVTAWFYDDAAETVLEGPFLKIMLSDGSFIQMGARNGTSTTHYSCNPPATFTEDTFAVTAVARSTGWHKFQIKYNNVWVRFEIYIDGVDVLHLTPPTTYVVESIYLQAAVLGNAVDSFGYFDELRYQQDWYTFFWGVAGRRINVVGLGHTDQAISGPGNLYKLEANTNPEANAYDIEISQAIPSATVIGNYEKLAMSRYDMDYQGGDAFMFKEVDFTRRPTAYAGERPTTRGSRSQSPTGTTETITTGRQDTAPFEVDGLQGVEWLQRAQDYFDYARTGEPFAFALDSDDTVVAQLAADAAAFQSQVTVIPTLDVNGSGIQEDQYYIIEDQGRNHRQVLRVIDVTANAVTFDGLLHYDYEVGDYVRSMRYWPLMEMADPITYPLSIAKPKSITYKWSQNIREWVP